MAAGAISGMIFKSTKGTKPMLISGGLVATAAGVWAVSFFLQQQQRLGFILTRFSLAVKCSFNFLHSIDFLDHCIIFGMAYHDSSIQY
jgi:hypothetical protein